MTLSCAAATGELGRQCSAGLQSVQRLCVAQDTAGAATLVRGQAEPLQRSAVAQSARRSHLLRGAGSRPGPACRQRVTGVRSEITYASLSQSKVVIVVTFAIKTTYWQPAVHLPSSQDKQVREHNWIAEP